MQTQENEDKKTNPDLEALEIEIIDDTPEADRGREKLPEKIVKELEEDDLSEYSDKVKKRLSQMKKVWHDERREKEAAKREADEAARLAQAKDSQIKELEKKLGAGEKTYVDDMTKAVTVELESAKTRLEQAFEGGDPKTITAAQEAVFDAKIKLKEIQFSRPTPLQTEEKGVETTQQRQESQPHVDPKAEAWRAKNTWFGVDEEMTSLALGLHNKLVRSKVDPRSDEYYKQLDMTMRKRFPEYFDDGTKTDDEIDGEQSTTATEKKSESRKPNVVAPVTRSTAPKKVRLTQTQLGLAKRLGLSPEQYASEMIKLENNNG